MTQLPNSIARRTSPSTGLSYLCSGNLSNPIRLYICFHGWACSATDYVPLISALVSDKNFSRNVLIIALDFPGHGSSPKSICPQPSVSGFAALADDLRRELSPADGLLDTLLVGHSMGCRMAIEAISKLKKNVSALILLDGSWVGRNPEVHALPSTADIEKEIQRISDRIGMYGPLTPQSFVDEMVGRLREIDLDYEYELSSEYIEWDRERMEDALDEIGRSAGIRTLVIQSTQGRGASRRPLMKEEEGPWVAFVRDKIGSESFTNTTIEGCGHWPHIDKAAEVAQIIWSFERDK